MSTLLVRPGPLEGGPMVSPGPAKGGGEPFTAHLKQACGHSAGKSTPPSVKPMGDRPGPSDPPPKESPASSTEGEADQAEQPAGSPPASKGKGTIPLKGSEKASNAIPDVAIVERAVPENAETAVVALLINIPLPAAKTPAERAETEGDPGVSLPSTIAGAIPTDLPPVSAETSDETAADFDVPKKEEPVKVEAKPPEAPTVVLLPVNLAAVAPTESSVPAETEISLAPVKEEGVSVPPAEANEPLLEPVGPRPAVGLDKDIVPLPKPSDLKNVVRSKDSPDLSKKKGEPSSVPVTDAAEKTPEDRPDFRVAVDPIPREFRPEPKGSVTQNPEKEAHKPPPEQEAPVPAVVFQPEAPAPISWTTDAVPKQKEISGIAPLHSGMAAQSGPLAQGTPEPVQNSAPVLEETPAKAGAKTGPVEIARQIHVHLESGRSVVRIDLHPEHLGELRISMETKGKDVSMRFTVENENARTTVVAGLREITGTLSSLGWSVSGLVVNVSSGGVGNGRGESHGPVWGESKNISNTVLPEPIRSSPRRETGQWRVDLVA